MSPSHRTIPVLLLTAVFGLAACHQRPGSLYDSTGLSPKTKGAVAAAPVTVESADGAAAPGAARGDFGEMRTSRIEDLFAGRFPGLDVHRTSDGGIAMRLRGAQPLLLIDNLEADPVALLAVQPRSVLRIEVLRNVSETAIYGSRGVNGVVRVTTRR